MGNAPSTDVAAGLDGVQTTPQPQGNTTLLYKWVPAGRAGNWELVSSNASIQLYDANEDAASKKPEWHIEIEGAQESPDVVLNDTFEFDTKQQRCSFFTDDAVWALQFPSPRAFDIFCSKYNKALFENKFGLEDTAENELKIFGNDFMMHFHPENEDSRQEWVNDMDIDKPHPSERKSTRKDSVAAEREAIQGIVLGAGERSFLIRDNEIDVMGNVYGGVVDKDINFKLTPPPSSKKGTPGSGFTPSKALLASGERKMNMLSAASPTSLYHADLETGKVVSEWSFQKDGVEIPFKDIASQSKAAQMEDTKMFYALDANRLAKFDLRTSEGIVQETMSSPAALSYVGGKDYSRGTKFSCMATSGDGFVVVGSDDGKVRLYSENTLTQAKTAIPGLGAPVTNVDVTYDGKWVLATTGSYLMVVKTAYKDKATGKELCGFTSRMGANAPAPRLLRLKPADVALTGGAPLEKAHFTWITEKGRQERWIVASCGRYTVLWNFRTVKLAESSVISIGGLTTVTNYHLIPKTESVIDSVFMHDKYNRTPTGLDETSMVVVTNKKVYTVAEGSEDEEEEEVPRRLF